jgi:hypothetical protein
LGPIPNPQSPIPISQTLDKSLINQQKLKFNNMNYAKIIHTS